MIWQLAHNSYTCLETHATAICFAIPRWQSLWPQCRFSLPMCREWRTLCNCTKARQCLGRRPCRREGRPLRRSLLSAVTKTTLNSFFTRFPFINILTATAVNPHAKRKTSFSREMYFVERSPKMACGHNVHNLLSILVQENAVRNLHTCKTCVYLFACMFVRGSQVLKDCE